MTEIEINEDGRICINGELSFATVSHLVQRGCAFLLQSDRSVFDLEKVSFADNAGVALLISLMRYAKRNNKVTSFVNLPKQLLSLIEASGLRNILPIN
jgi:anti-anti-sigma factor